MASTNAIVDGIDVTLQATMLTVYYYKYLTVSSTVNQLTASTSLKQTPHFTQQASQHTDRLTELAITVQILSNKVNLKVQINLNVLISYSKVIR